jgi:hypothetical protein
MLFFRWGSVVVAGATGATAAYIAVMLYPLGYIYSCPLPYVGVTYMSTDTYVHTIG